MQRQYNVLAPGPVNLHPEVQKTLALPMIHHRTPEFDAILKRVLTRLKSIFKTEQDVFILTSTGSGGMEALLVNVLSPQDKVLGIDSGKFGERWCEMARAYQADVHVIKTEWGQAVKVQEVKNFLDNNPDTKIILCQACETSTGVLHPIHALGELIQNYPQTLFLVDGITALGAVPLPMDQWKIDGLVGGSQKAFMLPTGLSLLSFSQKAWKIIPTAKTPRFYFDIRKEQKANQAGETFFSSNVSLIRALDVVLDRILAVGWDQHLHHIERRAEFTRLFAKDLGLELYAQAPSNSVTALKVPSGIDGQKLRSELEKQHQITIMGGQDQAKGKIIRIGHMGYIQPEQMVQLMLKISEILKQMAPQLSQPDAQKWQVELGNWWKTHA